MLMHTMVFRGIFQICLLRTIRQKIIVYLLNGTNSLLFFFSARFKTYEDTTKWRSTVILLLPTSVKIQWVQCILHSFLSVHVYLYMPPIYAYTTIYTQFTLFMYICYENG